MENLNLDRSEGVQGIQKNLKEFRCIIFIINLRINRGIRKLSIIY
jgi:hypothetical protein